MKDVSDKVTGELVPVQRKRGRPASGTAMTGAERVAAHRARKGLVKVSIDLPAELVEGLNEYLRFKETTKNEVFAKLIRSQLLRKR